MRLDDNLYNPSTSINEYKLDDFQRDSNYQTGESLMIPPDKIHQLVLESGKEKFKIRAIYLGDIDKISVDTVIMYCHGNKNHMDTYWPRAKMLAHTGRKNRLGVMMVDYRGFGLSEGKPTEEGMYEDVTASLKWLKDHGLKGGRLIMYGYSVGTAPATELTAYPRALRPAKLILESPFASARKMVRDASKLALPASFFTNLDIDNAEKIKQVDQPFMWLHGEEDHFLQISHGEEVFNNYKGQGGVPVRVPKANHTSIPKTMKIEHYLDTLEHFIFN